MNAAPANLSAEEVAAMMRDQEARARERPADYYIAGSPERYPDPADRYQLQFHQSRHIYRMLVLGNGAGKSTTGGVEADYWLQHNHPYQPIPKWPIQVIWICQKFQQFDEQRDQFERRCFTAGFEWNDSDHRYTWPNRSHMTVFSNDGNWAGAQGIEADIVFVDEECDPKLWTELRARRRGDKKTRYVITATATKGKRWMFKDIYEPWLKHHAEQGLSEREAMRVQTHKYYWVWPMGGALDNPSNTQEDADHLQEAFINLSPAEQSARLKGGFHDFNQSPVFNQVAINEIEKEITKDGLKGQLIDKAGTQPDVIQIKDGPDDAPQWFNHADFPSFRSRFDFQPTGEAWLGGYLVIYELPRADAHYVMGMDYAQGLQTGDYDAAMVCRGEGERLIQVAEAVGHWGQTVAPMLFFMLGYFFNEALAVGEANSMGLGNMQLMWKLGYTYQYFREQKQDAKVSPKTDRLGYFKNSPVPIQRLQQTIAPYAAGTMQRLKPRIRFRSRQALEQHRKYQWRPSSSNKDISEARDVELVMGAPSGLNDDLVSAAAGCVIGWKELPRFERPAAIIKKGTIGDMLGHADVLLGKKPAGPFTHAKR